MNLREELPGFYRKLGCAPYDTAPFHEPSTLRMPAHLVLMTKALVSLCLCGPLLVILGLVAGCRKTEPPAPASTADAPPPTGATWDPWEEAKSRGIDFRAVGNEPGWFLEIDNEKWMRLLYAYGERQATVPVTTPVTTAGTTRIESSGGGHALKVEITAGPCSDGMSDQSYPLSVTVEIDGTPLRGCGRALAPSAPGATEASRPAGKTSRR